MRPYAATYLAVLGSATPFKRAPVVPHIPQIRTLPPCTGGLRYRHTSRGSEPHLPVQEGSGAPKRPAAPNPASPLGMASVPSWDLPVSVRMNNELFGSNGEITRLVRYRGALTCTEAPTSLAGRRHHHDLQDMQTSRYSTVLQYYDTRQTARGHG
jgi:hypothetical protein